MDAESKPPGRPADAREAAAGGSVTTQPVHGEARGAAWGTPTIETPRLILRPWRDEDLVPYAQINADPEVRRYMHPPRPLNEAESALEIDHLVDSWRRLGFGHWAVELRETGELIGRTGIKRHHDWEPDPQNTEVGWLYARSAWGRGLATEGASASVRFCLDAVAPPEVISIAHIANLPSHRVMKKAGLSWAGARHWFERGIDVVWYSSRGMAEKTGD